MDINLDDVKSLKLPTVPTGTPTVTVIMKDGTQQVLHGAGATVLLTEWSKHQKQKEG
jgi:hypothetical protein